MDTVLITTSGLGSRLGDITKYTNKSLVQIGDKYAICYIIDKYDLSKTRIVITLGYKGDLVREFLDIAYENNKFIYIYVDNYEGLGSCLGYSLLCARNELQCPFTFYCCDSIVLDEIIHPGKNVIYVSKVSDTGSYASLDMDNKYITRIYDKGESITNDYIYTGVSHIQDYIQYWKFLEINYKKYLNIGDIETINSLIDDDVKIEYKILNDWYDIGNTKTYNETCKKIKCSYDILRKNTESLCFMDHKVIKFISDEFILNDIVQRGKQLYPYSPKILNHTKHFYSMEYIHGTVISKCYTRGEIKKILEWANKNIWNDKKTNTNYVKTCERFYKDKTFNRIKQLKWLKYEMNKINGIIIPDINSLLGSLDWGILYTNTFCNYHGDFILDNIIKTENTYKIIDWRNNFIDEIMQGDVYYDLAKFKHSIILNHYNIENNMFICEKLEDEIVLDLKCNYFLIEQLSDFNEFIHKNNYDINKINIIMSLIWINMSPLYDDKKLSEFLFYFGKYNLYLNTTINIT